MGILSKVAKTVAYSSIAGASTFVLLTKDSKFVPLPMTDQVFSSAAYSRYNPNKHPATQDLCVKKVPLSKIRPSLLEKDGKLTEAFCAGVWSGIGTVA